MKKTYVKPEIQVFLISKPMLLAGSDPMKASFSDESSIEDGGRHFVRRYLLNRLIIIYSTFGSDFHFRKLSFFIYKKGENVWLNVYYFVSLQALFIIL